MFGRRLSAIGCRMSITANGRRRATSHPRPSTLDWPDAADCRPSTGYSRASTLSGALKSKTRVVLPAGLFRPAGHRFPNTHRGPAGDDVTATMRVTGEVDASPRRDRYPGQHPARPTRAGSSPRSVLSNVTIWETLATDSFESPVTPGGSSTFPGAVAHFMLLVRGTQTTVAIRLRFNASPCTTTTGRRNPGPEPRGSGRSAHQTSPCAMLTSHYA
jgi:hypothetical protein